MTDATNFAGDKDDYYDSIKRLAKILQEVKDERDSLRSALGEALNLIEDPARYWNDDDLQLRLKGLAWPAAQVVERD